MPIAEIECPRCGTAVPLGLPRGAAVKSVTATERSRPSDPHLKLRRLVCDNDHEFQVMFEL